MTVYSHFVSKEGLFEAVVRDRTERVMGGLADVEALDPKQPRKALLAIGKQFLVLAREEDALGKFRSVYGAAGAYPERAWPSIARGRTALSATWRRTCAAPAARRAKHRPRPTPTPGHAGPRYARVGHDWAARSDVTRDQRGGMAIILCRHDRGNCADRALAGIALLAIARGNRRRESVPSNQHRLLGEDSRHRALP
jgi:AcrR family transcriptional regulator